MSHCYLPFLHLYCQRPFSCNSFLASERTTSGVDMYMSRSSEESAMPTPVAHFLCNNSRCNRCVTSRSPKHAPRNCYCARAVYGAVQCTLFHNKAALRFITIKESAKNCWNTSVCGWVQTINYTTARERVICNFLSYQYEQ